MIANRDENVLKLSMAMVAQLCTKNHRIVHFKWMNRLVGKLYLNKLLKIFHFVQINTVVITGITHCP